MAGAAGPAALWRRTDRGPRIMNQVILLAVVFLLLAVILETVAAGRAAPNPASNPAPNPARSPACPARPAVRPFLTARETAMLATLEQILPHCRIHARVAIDALLGAPSGLGRPRHRAEGGVAATPTIDFVAQDRDSGAILALIEVDDRAFRAAADRARDAATAHAGYRTIRIPARTRPTPHEVQAIVSDLGPPVSSPASPVRRW
jgi:hypothetical protein